MQTKITDVLLTVTGSYWGATHFDDLFHTVLAAAVPLLIKEALTFGFGLLRARKKGGVQ